MKAARTKVFDVLLELVVLLLRLDAGQLHAVVAAELGRLVPVGLGVDWKSDKGAQMWSVICFEKRTQLEPAPPLRVS